ncbi:conserved hypothetical protein [Cupriavidus taiwanensis]|nr:conserved hypothetical protein [Cupriavidus taiwanensis]
MLRRHRVALVISDAVADWPYAEDVTSNFLYLRLHGTETLYGGAYSDTALDRWAARLVKWAKWRRTRRRAADLAKTPSRRRASGHLLLFR